MKKIEISLFKKNLTVDTNSSEFQYIERIEYSFIVYIEWFDTCQCRFREDKTVEIVHFLWLLKIELSPISKWVKSFLIQLVRWFSSTRLISVCVTITVIFFTFWIPSSHPFPWRPWSPPCLSVLETKSINYHIRRIEETLPWVFLNLLGTLSV